MTCDDETECRLIAIAEDRVRAAEEVGVSAGGVFASLLAHINGGDYLAAAEELKWLDERIEAARQSAKK